jgi:SET domain-containing protein
MPARKSAKTNGSRNGVHNANGKTNGYPFRIGRSRTGLGIFATEPIKKGTYIAEYTGPLMTNKECDETAENKYWFEVNSRWTINGATRKNIARYFNHSCRPNADPMIRDRRVRIKTIKNIAPGDEITYNYGKDYHDAYIKPHGCKCDKCIEKRAKERAEARAASVRRKQRAARKAAQAAAAR